MDRPRHAEVAGAMIVGQCSIHKPYMHCGGCGKKKLPAENSGRRIAPPPETPAKGALIRDFQLSSAEGKQILLSKYRGQFNMVLILAGESNGAADFLSTVQRHQTELAENETGVLVVFAGSQQHASDLKNSLHLDFEVAARIG